MAQVNIYEAKTHLSRLLRRVRSGEEIIIAEAGKPIARLSPIHREPERRRLGGDEETVAIAADFDAPLPEALLDEFYCTAATRKPVKAHRTSTRKVRRQ